MRKLVLLFAMMYFSPCLLAQNLLVNGDWETGNTTGWGPRFGGGTITAISENPTPRSGMYCGKQAGRTQTWHGTIQTQNMLDVLERGRTYTYSVWIRTDTDTPINVAMSMQSNPAGEDARYFGIDNVLADNTAWYNMTGQYTFPTEAEDNGTEFIFYFEVNGSATAELYIDDAFLGTELAVNAPYDPFVEPYLEDGQTVGTPYTIDNVNSFVDDVVLTFKAGVNPETGDGVDPFIAMHNVYLSTGMPDDPNLYLIETLPQISTTDPSQALALADVATGPIILKAGTTYRWQVKQILKDLDGVPFTDDDTNNISGEVWTFTTTSPFPAVLSITDHMLIDDNGDASYTITVSPNGTHFRWFKAVGEVDSTENGETNDIMLTDAGIYSGTTTKTLNITGAAMDGSDDARLYARAYSGDPELSTSTVSVASPERWLWAPLLKSHFTFDTLSGGTTSDSVGGFVATMIKDDTGAANPVKSAELAYGLPELGGRSLSFGGNTGTSNTGNYALLTPGVVDYKDITISAWVYYKGGNSWQRIIDCGNNSDNFLFISANGVFAVKRNGTESAVSTSGLPSKAWTFVTATLNGDTARIYINGELKNTGTITYNPIDIGSSKNYLAKSQWPHDAYLNGVIDDLKIYNYARTTRQIALDYLALRGEWVCDRESYDLEYDFDDNCQVDILDFAEFASTWMSSYRIYPGQN